MCDLSFNKFPLLPYPLLLPDTYTYICIYYSSHLSCSMSFHSPLGTFPPSLLNYLFSLFAQCHFLCCTFWFVSPCRVVLLVVSLVRLSLPLSLSAFLLHVIPVFRFGFFSFFFFFTFWWSVIYVQQFLKLSRLFSPSMMMMLSVSRWYITCNWK